MAYSRRKRTIQKTVFMCFRLLSYFIALLLFYILGFILIKGAGVINWDFITMPPTDGMTADWVHLPYDFLARVSNDIINRVRGINRVV